MLDKALALSFLFIFFLVAYWLWVSTPNISLNTTLPNISYNYSHNYTANLLKTDYEKLTNQLICSQIYFYNLTNLTLYGITCYRWENRTCICIMPL